MRFQNLCRHATVLFLFSLIVFSGVPARADLTPFTREYRLKNNDAQVVIQVINFAIPNPSKKRILGGEGRKLVVTDTAPNQDEIAMILPVIDQIPKETEPRRIQMEMVVRVTKYLNRRQKAKDSDSSTGARPAGGSGGGFAGTYDIRNSTTAYKSVYSDEDEKLSKKPRVIKDDPVLPSVSNLVLKGIFLAVANKPTALLTYENNNFTARDGGLYYMNRMKMKGITTKVLKDRVIVTGLDKIPREIKFKSSL